MGRRPVRNPSPSQYVAAQDCEGLASVLIPIGVWQDMEGLPWIRMATPEERRVFIATLWRFIDNDRTAESLYHELKHDGRLQYALVTLLDGTPKCILKKAAEKIRLRSLCG